MKARLIALFATLTVLTAAIALAVPTPASAYGPDALHQYTWSGTYQLFEPQFQGTPQRCGSATSWNGNIIGLGRVQFFLPDRVTSPGATYPNGKRVFLTALLEQYTSSGWQAVDSWKPWVYTWANNTGYIPDWYDWNSANPFRGHEYLSWDVWPGYYRVWFYFSWQFDGKTYLDRSDYCQVTVLDTSM